MAQVGSLAGDGGMLFALCLMFLVPLAVPEDLPGGRVELPISDPEVQKASALAVESFNTQSSSDFYYKALKILKAESQVEDGIKYYLTIDLGKTNCKKTLGYDLPQAQLAKCKVSAEAKQQKYNCEFEVWMNEKKTGSEIQTWRRLSWRCTTTIPVAASK